VTIVLLAVAALAIFVIAALAVGVTSQRLAREHPATVFSVEEAVAFISERLEPDVAAEMSYEDVRRVVRWYVGYLDANELTDEDAYDSGGSLIVVDTDLTLGYLLDQGVTAEPPVRAEDVAVVHGALLAYLEAIGAVGSEAAAPADPDS
jgi:hypothetical protein